MNDLRFLRVDVGDGYFLAEEREAPRVDAAITAYLSSGQSRDELIELELIDGETLSIRVSTIHSFYISTPERRRAQIEREKRLADEIKDIKASLGIFESEE